MPAKVTYKTKSIDLLYFMLAILVFAIFFHTIGTLLRGEGSWNERIDNFQSIGFFTFFLVLTLIVFSPFLGFRRQYPRELEIDTETGMLKIVKRKSKKPLEINKDDLELLYHYKTFVFKA